MSTAQRLLKNAVQKDEYAESANTFKMLSRDPALHQIHLKVSYFDLIHKHWSLPAVRESKNIHKNATIISSYYEINFIKLTNVKVNKPFAALTPTLSNN